MDHESCHQSLREKEENFGILFSEYSKPTVENIKSVFHKIRTNFETKMNLQVCIKLGFFEEQQQQQRHSCNPMTLENEVLRHHDGRHSEEGSDSNVLGISSIENEGVYKVPQLKENSRVGRIVFTPKVSSP